jgi:hypothetical protein
MLFVAASCQPLPYSGLQRTILKECWRPSFARSLVPKLHGLTRDLAAYLRFYNSGRSGP